MVLLQVFASWKTEGMDREIPDDVRRLTLSAVKTGTALFQVPEVLSALSEYVSGEIRSRAGAGSFAALCGNPGAGKGSTGTFGNSQARKISENQRFYVPGSCYRVCIYDKDNVFCGSGA